MPTNDEVVENIHTTLTREIRPIRNWHEWLALWKSATTTEEMTGLLHVGFNVSLKQEQRNEKEYDEIDRFVFYFSIAEGWADHYLLELPTDRNKMYAIGYDRNGNLIQKRPSELRQQVACKAFDMLCLNFFKKELLDRSADRLDFDEVWKKSVLSERLFLVIRNFFRVEKDQYRDRTNIRNLSHTPRERSHNEQQAVTFLLNLARFLWMWKGPIDSQYWADDEKEDLAKKRLKIDSAKPWIIEVLADLDKLDVLHGWVLELDKSCLDKLKEIAMRAELLAWNIGEKSKRVTTLDEACYVGSKAAWFLKKHELMTREDARLRAIREAEEKKAEADREIKKLTAK